ncbi:PREDICTED: uncharacterized protein LOC109216388 [Nicotiana attenuata]|uniref:uncharacterized protein LOC109216388 n=1 Tax=Nicotiana attenuata TaxID=49451 RepID=UPI000904E625|nr:PREDICTED: uncharacterized protein LOC109216388 [Nicotiana attenuata]
MPRKQLLWMSRMEYHGAKDQKMTHSAELWYNCSMAYKFLENALTGLIMDPNLKSLEWTLNLCDVLDYINSLLQKLNDAKQLSSPTSSPLASVELDPSYERANVNRLTEGLNEGKAVTAVKNLSKALSVQMSGFSATWSSCLS